MIICPACGNQLSLYKEGPVEVDICKGGCGGAWFDEGELTKIGDGESISFDLLRTQLNKQVVTDYNKPRQCPRCPSQPLDRHYFRESDDIEIDQCMKCGGMWLDLGELAATVAADTMREKTEKIYSDFVRRADQSNRRGKRGIRAILELLFR